MGKKSPYDWLPRPGRIAVTFVLVLFSWVLFRSPSLHHAISYMGAMVGASASTGAPALLAAEIYTNHMLTVFGLCTVISFQPMEVTDWVAALTWPRALALAPLLLIALGTMFTQAFNPFLYFQF